MDITVELVGSVLGGLIGLLSGYIMNVRRQRRELKKSHDELLNLFREMQLAHQADARDYEKWHQEQLNYISTCQAQIQARNESIAKLTSQLNSLKQVHLN
ncbi:hypothetical protein GO755_40100 [Spirosoma sp. HMF4905]|uniref:Uncharacterized protein n=1 Tax=Spirosoma arboris TaxID=2682092 RepID=A0A7K1SRA6_9BACT|nr:hypothetical protein [Spirosoma arboris]MVM36280.1 hypothetical protein [Spirosoma arboris]